MACAGAVKRHRIIFTGAGLSKPWGGFLEKEIRSLLISRLNDVPDARDVLLNRFNEGRTYEGVLEHFQQRGNQSRVVSRFLEALVEIFHVHHRIVATNQRHSYGFSTFLKGLQALESTSKISIYTLNNDVLQEMMISSQLKTGFGFCYPGMPELSREFTRDLATSFTPSSCELDSWRGGPLVAGEQCIPIYKLHGSYNWTFQGGTAIIAGGQKLQNMKGVPLLKGYFQQFQRDLSETPVDLICIGYGFGDEHINRHICVRPKGTTQTQFRFFRVDPEEPADWYHERVHSRIRRASDRVKVPVTALTAGYYIGGVEDLIGPRRGPYGEAPYLGDLMNTLKSG